MPLTLAHPTVPALRLVGLSRDMAALQFGNPVGRRVHWSEPPVVDWDDYEHHGAAVRRFWYAPMTLPSEEQLRSHQADLLREWQHPRVELVESGSNMLRVAYLAEQWTMHADIDAFLPPCAWCWCPTGGWCSGVPSRPAERYPGWECRTPLCSWCEALLGCCTSCVLWRGLVCNAPLHWRATGAPSQPHSVRGLGPTARSWQRFGRLPLPQTWPGILQALWNLWLAHCRRNGMREPRAVGDWGIGRKDVVTLLLREVERDDDAQLFGIGDDDEVASTVATEGDYMGMGDRGQGGLTPVSSSGSIHQDASSFQDGELVGAAFLADR